MNIALLSLSVVLLKPIPASHVLLVGRFDTTHPGAAACQWPASEVRFTTNADRITVSFDEQGSDFWQVVVDGRPTQVLKLQPGPGSYTVDLGTIRKHEVRLVKRTEAFVGTTKFVEVQPSVGQIRPAMPKRRHIEVVGDSISCGYGNEGQNQNEHFKPETENAYESYASVAARELNADVTILAWSGRKMWPDNTVPEIYDRILPTQPTPLWDFKGPPPDAVVINLATNDFGKGNPDEQKWTSAYEQFVKRVWSHYPRAQVYAAIGSMMTDAYPPNQHALSTLRTYLEHMVGKIADPRLHILEFSVQRQEDGLGSDWHPNLKTHHIMGDKLAQVLKRDLNW